MLCRAEDVLGPALRVVKTASLESGMSDACRSSGDRLHTLEACALSCCVMFFVPQATCADGCLLHCPRECVACSPQASKIHVLVLDEAHHVSQQDAYAQILKNFVNKLPYAKRPRILGLTATPLQASILHVYS